MIAAYMNQTPLSYLSHCIFLLNYKQYGIFKSMFNFLEKVAVERNCTCFKLEVGNDNVPAIETYLKSGFEISSRMSDSSLYVKKIK